MVNKFIIRDEDDLEVAKSIVPHIAEAFPEVFDADTMLLFNGEESVWRAESRVTGPVEMLDFMGDTGAIYIERLGRAFLGMWHYHDPDASILEVGKDQYYTENGDKVDLCVFCLPHYQFMPATHEYRGFKMCDECWERLGLDY